MEQVSNNERLWRSGPWRVAAWSTAAAIMLLPISVQLVHGNFGWGLEDFVFVGGLLLVSCLIFDFAARRSPNFSYLAGSAAALAAGFGLILVNAAVGLVGSEDEAHNLLFLPVILIAAGGVILARGRPAGLARVMFAAAAAHIIVSAFLLIRSGGVSDGNPMAEVVGLSVFAAMWLASAAFFRNAAR